MDKEITIRELTAPQDAEQFWKELHAYFQRDLFPENKEELEEFLSEEYRHSITALHERETDPLYWLFFQRGGRDIGLAMPDIFRSEDGKCFILEFCVFPEYRGGGTGQACAAALLNWARARGAAYFELNADVERRRRFWRSVGFLPNGADEWGMPLMLFPPAERLPFTVEVLGDPDDPDLGWQLHKLENGFLAEIGEEELTDEKKEALAQAIRKKRITFFLARRGYRAVGMCSVARCFSTFSCSEIGVFDDFFVEPVFRRQGIARQLTAFAQRWCKEQGLASLTVGCSPGDAGMYRSLGFETDLGTMLACPLL